MLVNEKNHKQFLVTLNTLEEVKEYKKVGISTFVLALKDYSVGYPNTYSIEQINTFAEQKGIKVYCLINKMLENKDIDDLKILLKEIKCSGFIIEDVGLIHFLKQENNEVILFINHFNCNYLSINAWLSYVDSVFVSNELTYKELQEIANNVKKRVVFHLFGYNQVMYSRRYLLTNYQNYYHLEHHNTDTISDNGISFHLYENQNGTVGYSNKIFADKRILDLKNVYYFYLNTSFIPIKTTLDFLKEKDINNTDSAFLDKETVFKIGDIHD